MGSNSRFADVVCREVLATQTVADMRGVGVKNRGKFADVLCGQPLNTFVEFVKQSAMQLTKCKYLHI